MSLSVKLGLLALLREKPRHGYDLHAAFGEHTGDNWPLNSGQVYTTLQRLERDGLVESDDGDEQGRQFYALTDAGRTEVDRWFASPIPRADRPRDDVAVKLAIAVAAGADVRELIQSQRAVAMHDLQGLTLKKTHQDGADLASALVLESLIFQAEAEIRWLDHCEELLTDKGASHDRARTGPRHTGARTRRGVRRSA